MILGISLDENFIYVSTSENNEIISLPFSIGRNLSNKTWFIGDEAKNEDVDNVDIVIDKLYYIMENDVKATIGEDEYEAKELVKIFFKTLFNRFSNIEYVTLVLRNNNIKILKKIKYSFQSYFLEEKKYKITTYSEAFIAYIKNQEPDYYRGTVALFDFTERAITYYELVRYSSNDYKEYWKVYTNEYLALPLDLLSGEAGKIVCDNLLSEFSKKCIKDDNYSNIILSGLGFKDTSIYREFMTDICKIANVDTDINFFSKSALILAKQILEAKEDNLVIITDSRTTASIKLEAMVNHIEKQIILVEPGLEWFDVYNYSFDIILNGENEIKFEVHKIIEDEKSFFVVEIPKSFNVRQNKTTILQINLVFSQQNILEVSIKDNGFGEFFEPTNNITVKQKEI